MQYGPETDGFIAHGKMPDTYKIVAEINGHISELPKGLKGLIGHTEALTELEGLNWIRRFVEVISKNSIMSEIVGGVNRRVWGCNRMVSIRKTDDKILTVSMAPEGKNGY